MKRFFTWLKDRFETEDDEPRPAPRRPVVRATVRHARPRPATPEPVEFSTEFEGKIEDGGPGKNVLVRNKYLEEDTDTHEALKIVDAEDASAADEDGIDPYNTGRFDRSKSWDSFRTRN